MTYQTTMTTSGHGASALARVGAFFKSIARAMIENSSMQRRADVVRALQGKTDAELAALNLTRDQIIRHVYRDMYHI